jgi:hypothetical protein
MRKASRTHKAREITGKRKERKSFTLSQESIALLNELRASRKGDRRRSASAILDDLLRRLKAERKRQAVEQAVTNYYDSRSEELRAEENLWGDFALAQFVDKDV